MLVDQLSIRIDVYTLYIQLCFLSILMNSMESVKQPKVSLQIRIHARIDLISRSIKSTKDGNWLLDV